MKSSSSPGMLRLRLYIANSFVVVAHMQQAGERGHAVELFVAHNAQVIDIAFLPGLAER